MVKVYYRTRARYWFEFVVMSLLVFVLGYMTGRSIIRDKWRLEDERAEYERRLVNEKNEEAFRRMQAESCLTLMERIRVAKERTGEAR